MNTPLWELTAFYLFNDINMYGTLINPYMETYILKPLKKKSATALCI